jgi:hypothetical protein
MMNDIIAILYDRLFDWNTYQELSGMVFNNQDYSKLGWILILIPTLTLTIFYKFWDPVSNSKLKWFLTLLFVMIISYVGTSIILYNNFDIIQYIGNYTGEEGQPSADYFIFQMSAIGLVYALILSFVLSIILFRLISTNNRYNPF